MKTKLVNFINTSVYKQGDRESCSPETDRVTQNLIETCKTSIQECLISLQTSTDGLTDKERSLRLERFGYNKIVHEAAPTWYSQLIKSFLNPFIAVLFVIWIISLFTDVLIVKAEERSWKMLILISMMIFLSALIRFWQEFRSSQAAEKLKSIIITTATVVRKDYVNTEEILISELVPGDIIKLAAGDMIPADVRLIASKDLFVDQSILTGESYPVEKLDMAESIPSTIDATRDKEPNNPFEHFNICLMGTSVVTGTGMALVIATGNDTYLGSMAKKIVNIRATTSFDKGINQVSWLLIYFMLIMVPIVFLINGFTKHAWLDALLFAVSVAVGLTPEMLPMIVTANLAKGAIAMSRRKAIVKRLNAIQNFGSMNILCTDKTGTLTQNKIILIWYLDVYGKQDYQEVLRLAYLNSYYQTGLKNLLDLSVLDFVKENKFDFSREEHKKVDEIPFDFERRRMSVVINGSDNQHVLICKGATEEIFTICSQFADQESTKPMTENTKIENGKLMHRLQEEGFRVIAVAYKTLPAEDRPYTKHDESNLTLVGFVAFLDPPKETVIEAIKGLNEHGVNVKIITGDNEIVSRKICNEVGLAAENILVSSEIEQLSDDQLAEVATNTSIFAKVSPLQKSRIVRALQSKGHTVGYLGDGINDASALKVADVGISVDTAVDIARESADIILLDKDLMILIEGVLEGRKTFGNIIKYIKITTSSNFGNVFSILTASAFLPFLPMLPIQILMQNMLYDFSQISIPWDNIDKEYLQKPRRWDAGDIAKFMIFIGPISSIFDIITFIVMWNVFHANNIQHQALFQSGWFVVGLLTQTMIVHMLRTPKIPFLQSLASAPVMLLTGIIMLVGIIMPNTSLGANIGLIPLPNHYYYWLIGILLSYCTLTQLIKNWYIKKFHQWL